MEMQRNQNSKNNFGIGRQSGDKTLSDSRFILKLQYAKQCGNGIQTHRPVKHK